MQDELEKLGNGDCSSPEIYLQDPVVLDFLCPYSVSSELDLENAILFLEQIDNDELALLRAAVYIAMDDRSSAGAYLHHLVETHPEAQVKTTALTLLNIYYSYDTHRDTDIT